MSEVEPIITKYSGTVGFGSPASLRYAPIAGLAARRADPGFEKPQPPACYFLVIIQYTGTPASTIINPRRV